MSTSYSEAKPGRQSSAALPAGKRTQWARLLQLIVAIQSDRIFNARQLAELCEVSRRTIYRDLDTLEAAGIPIRYWPERQGYQIAKSFFFPPPALTEKEALALAVLARQWKGGDGLGLLRDARAGVMKLVQALPADVRGRVQSGSEPFELSVNPPDPPRDRQVLYDTILEALTRRLQLRIWHQDESQGIVRATKVSPYRLVMRDDVWRLLGLSTTQRSVQSFLVARIQRAELTEDTYTIPPRFHTERRLSQACGLERPESRCTVRLQFTARAAPEIRDRGWRRDQSLVDHPDGRLELRLVVDRLDEILGWVLGFGDQVEVLEPADLRARVFAVAGRVAAAHSPGRTHPTPSDRGAVADGREENGAVRAAPSVVSAEGG